MSERRPESHANASEALPKLRQDRHSLRPSVAGSQARVGRGVVSHENIEVEIGPLFEHTADRLLDKFCMIVGDNVDAQKHEGDTFFLILDLSRLVAIDTVVK
jgi:hypothetical protein